MSRRIYSLFFLSGASGLIYQILWVREFGNVFGNTIQSASLVIAVFMLGLGAGSYFAGRWADQSYAAARGSLLAVYGKVEIAIGALAFAISAVLPRLGVLSATVSRYVRGEDGWYVLSAGSYLARYAIAVLLLAPVTALMGATLTLLIRHLVGRNVASSGWPIAALYGANTAGAAAGCFLTDYAFVPAMGLRLTQGLAVGLNIIAGLGALQLASREARAAPRDGPGTARAHDDPGAVYAPDASSRTRGPGATPATQGRTTALAQAGPSSDPAVSRVARVEPAFGHAAPAGGSRLVLFTSLTLLLSGFAAMGMEILWFRHAGTLLGDYRSVFSLVLTVILAGIMLGALAGGGLERRFGHPALFFLLAQAAFVATALWGLASADVGGLIEHLVGVKDVFFAGAGARRAAVELWANARPLLLEIAAPSFLLGLSYPLANALVQRAESAVGRRAGALYLANTTGAVLGSLIVGFALLPAFGMQKTAAVLSAASGAGLVPLYLAFRSAPAHAPERRRTAAGLAAAVVLVGGAIALWVRLPSDHLLRRALQFRPGEDLVAVEEGAGVTVAVTQLASGTRSLWTNGYSIAATGRMAQRYMRAFAHVPLLSMDSPESVLVICFGVGNTSHAASLHPSVHRLEIVDLSKEVLDQGHFFAATNGNVLESPKVSVFANDGRHHLIVQPPGSYDLITLEPPPIAFAGVASLYSREFYELARSRLKPNGYMTQWLPAYQVDEATTLSMVRAFVDVFPTCVLLSGAYSDLILMGTRAPKLEIDPSLIEARLAAAPAVREDLDKVYLGTLMEFAGAFAGSAQTLRRATERSAAMTDDRPVLEYSTGSRLWDHRIPASLFDVTGVGAWCPGCASAGRPAPGLEDLGIYLEILQSMYQSPGFLRYTWPPLPASNRFPVALDAHTRRTIAASRYLSTHFH